MTSKSLEEFLAFLREAVQSHNIAVDNEKEANDASQDILHAIEFNAYNTRKTAQLVKTLQTVRKNRRAAKEAIEISSPILEWVEENQAVIKSLERLLGDVRKAERRIQERTYTPKTNIMEETL